MLFFKRDPLYKSFWLLKFINKIFRAGKRGKILSRIYNMFSNKKNSLDLELMFLECLEILRVPLVLKKVSYKKEIPIPISHYYQYKQSLIWLVSSIKQRHTLLEVSILYEFILVTSLNISSLSLKQKKKLESVIYKSRFFKNLPSKKI